VKITVVTVCLNAAPSIAWTIESVCAQDYADREHLILDGGSTDGTLDILARYSSERLTVLSEPDGGMYDALNKALRLFSGEVVGALNADDTFHDSTSLSRIAAAMEDADIVHGDLDFVTDHHSKRVVRRWRTAARPASGFRSGWMPAHPTFYVRRSVAESVGAYDISLKTAADYDWMLRAVELHYFRVRKVEGVLVDMMQGGRSTASLRAHLRHNLEALASRRRWLNVGSVDRAFVAKPARKIFQLFYR